MSGTRRRRLRARHERDLLAGPPARRRDAVAHRAPAGRDLDAVAKLLSATALVAVLIMIAMVLVA
jgi:hypothetical protein